MYDTGSQSLNLCILVQLIQSVVLVVVARFIGQRAVEYLNGVEANAANMYDAPERLICCPF